MSTHARRQGAIGIIGGSGIDELDGLTGNRWERVTGPFGAPSDELFMGELNGLKVVFLPRHGRGHRIPPGEINFRANIDALKRAGVTDVISLSAVGSLRGDFAPGMFVVVDQFIDRTFARVKTFFGTGCVAHVPFAHPVCARLGDALEAAGGVAGVRLARGGAYLAMEGPQFSTLAESELYRSWGASVIGMTNMPEAKLAREAELCYATVAMVTDFDCWHPHHASVTVQEVVKTMATNAASARSLLLATLPRLAERPALCPHGCDRALDHAILTAPGVRDSAVVARLDAVAGRVL
jgi:5'-methylthioadenosine phosphorylase